MQLADSWSFSSMAICGAGGDTEEELATEKIATCVLPLCLDLALHI